MDEFAVEDSDDVQTWSARIARAARDREARTVTLLIKSAAPIAAFSGRLDLIAAWLRHLPDERVLRDARLLYWSGTCLALSRPVDAYPRLLRAFEMLRERSAGHWGLLAWAGLVDVIFLLYRDLHELDPLIEWMTPEREAGVDRMPRPLRSLVVGSALFALTFRQPRHPRLPVWRDRAERLIEHNPTSDLGARMTAALILGSTWRGDLAAAEIVWKRFEARAARTGLSPLGAVLRPLNTATLRLHQGRLDECIAEVAAALAASSAHGIRVWDGVMHCLAITAHVSRGEIADARRHVGAIEELFAEGIPIDEAYYRAILHWCDFVAGDRLGVVPRCASVIEYTDIKGVPYFMAVCRLMSGLMLFELGHHETGRVLLADGIARGRELENPLLIWIGELFVAHAHYATGEVTKGENALKSALRLGRDHQLAHFFSWPRNIITALVDRALELDYERDYVAFLINVHSLTGGELPTRSDRWQFPVRIYLFGEPRLVHADGRVEPLVGQGFRQAELLSILIERARRPATVHEIAKNIYGDADVDPIANLKTVLHSLRKRIGMAVLQRSGVLTLDFEQVWIDASSYLWLSYETSDAQVLEPWLARHYHDHFMAGVVHSPIVTRVRELLSKKAERVIRAALAESRERGDEANVQRLEARWHVLFPKVFASATR